MPHTQTTTVKARPGRPSNPNSNRQVQLAERAARIAAGGSASKGRPTNQSSARQMKLAERAALIASGVVIKRGRKPMPKAEETPAE